MPSVLPSSITSVAISTPQASGGMSRRTPAMPSASSSAAMTTTTGGKRRSGWAARNARTASSRTACV